MLPLQRTRSNPQRIFFLTVRSKNTVSRPNCSLNGYAICPYINNLCVVGHWSTIHGSQSMCFWISLREANIFINNKFWEELIACFPLIRRGPYRKRRVQQLFYCLVCIRYRGNVFTKPLPINSREIHIEAHRLMEGIYEVGRWDGLNTMIYTPSFIKISSSIKKLIRGIHRHIDSMVIS
jgi:hypothetical protein